MFFHLDQGLNVKTQFIFKVNDLCFVIGEYFYSQIKKKYHEVGTKKRTSKNPPDELSKNPPDELSKNPPDELSKLFRKNNFLIFFLCCKKVPELYFAMNVINALSSISLRHFILKNLQEFYVVIFKAHLKFSHKVFFICA